MNYSYILWDFNGTLFDDVEAAVKSVNVLLKRRGNGEIENIENYRRIFSFPVIDYYKKLGFDFDKEPFDVLAVEWLEQYLKFSRSSSLSSGAEEILKYVADTGCRQVVLSASERNMLLKQLSELGIKDYFCEILGLGDIYAGSKEKIAQNWVRKTSPGRILMIGDTDHDFMVAEGIGADCLLVSCGHQSYDSLSNYGVPVAESLTDIIKYLE